MLRRWWTTRVFQSRVKRAVTHFNTLMPQQRLVVFIQLLREHPELAIQFRRALRMEDAKQDRRVELATALPRR
jgi:hypothetical protein